MSNHNKNSEVKISSQIQPKYDKIHQVKFGSNDIGLLRNQHKDREIINPKHIESWIEEFLKEAESTKVQGTMMKIKANSPLAQYRLDRNSLHKLNLSHDLIDRIYRLLFL
jgi:hypothetical protein